MTDKTPWTVTGVDREAAKCISRDLPQGTVNRFWAKVSVGHPDECWAWNGALSVNRRGVGYGSFGSAATGTVRAHRLAYTLKIGAIPSGMVLDHLCRNPLCVNPGHLEPVTNQENVRRGLAYRTHCPSGHPYTESSTYRRADGSRRCKTCVNAQNRKSYAKLAKLGAKS